MLNDIDNSFLFRNLLNLESKEEILTPEEGFIIGNMFYNLYQPYKNYKPQRITPKSEQEALFLKIQELDFAVNDLGLYLDLNPKNEKVLHLYKKYVKELRESMNLYCEKYEPLTVLDDYKEGFDWIKNPWPWEGNNV